MKSDLNVKQMSDSHELRCLARRGGLFFAVFGVLWLFFYTIYEAFPFIRPGSDLVYAAKLRSIGNQRLFPQDARCRIAVFGNSRILAGIRPEQLDMEVGGGCKSFNFGLPNATHFMIELQRLVAAGDTPTHVLLQVPWSNEAAPDALAWLKDDKRTIEKLFPFRSLPRNLVVFLYSSRRHGGVVSFYKEAQQTAERVVDDRGYFFIKGQSHFPNHRLPQDYKLPTDAPTVVPNREIPIDVPMFTQLRELAERENMSVILIPDYFRVGAYAPPPPSNELASERLAPYSRFSIAGPDYFLFKNQLFSDPVHLNPEGARRYTSVIADLLKKELARQR